MTLKEKCLVIELIFKDIARETIKILN